MVGTSSDPGSAFVFNSDPDSDDALRHNAMLAAAATDDSAYDFDSGFPSAFNSDSSSASVPAQFAVCLFGFRQLAGVFLFIFVFQFQFQ
jgi:hypothetical protein